ncbi:MAG: hypothetical protein HYS41_02930 [Candidatus Omnitrophica bacterium]|nr:hypothetical protein [Candidatus Omnitrophota bacterium]
MQRPIAPPTIDLKRLARYSLASRKSKVAWDAFAKTTPRGASFRAFFDGLPKILAGESLHRLVEAIVQARRRGKPVILLLGAHVLKVGLSPLIVDWIERGVVTAAAANGAGIIHDFELAYQGKTSEEVAEALADGSFGMARETADLLNGAIGQGAKEKLGLGESVGRLIEKGRFRFKKLSLFAACWRKKIPATVHVAIGTDIIHQHPSCDGSAVGAASLTDFRKLTQAVSGLGGGGVVLNIGSAVILPEVFLKAVSTCRNLGFTVKDFTAANLDMIQHYRPHQNILLRPTALGGQRINLIGHHEILVPLLHAAVNERLK